MTEKIRYHVTFAGNGHIGLDGTRQVVIVAYQQRRRIAFATGLRLLPSQLTGGIVAGHPLATKYNAYLYRMRNEIEEMELDLILRGRVVTLDVLRDAYISHQAPGAKLRDFVSGVIDASDRQPTTRQAYHVLVKSIEQLRPDVTVADVTRDLVEQWRQHMRSRHLSENTVRGRLKQLRCVINEAVKRGIVSADDDPFRHIVIGNIEPRQGYLSGADITRLKKLTLSGREAHVRDAFLFCCFTGLRFSDFRALTTANIAAGILTIRQQKTRRQLTIPLRHLFGGEPLTILARYPSVEALAAVGHNTSANRTLKAIAEKAHISKRMFWHLARHTCATLLNQQGMQMHEIQRILGHARIATTAAHYAETTATQLDKSLRKAFKKKEGG